MSAFDADHLHEQVNKVMSTESLPPGAKGAFVIVGTSSGATAVIAARVGGHWEVQGSVDYSKGDVTLGAIVKAVW